MKNKKLLLSLGVLSATVPVMAAVSCSTSWTKWNKSDEDSHPKFKYPKLKLGPEDMWKVRDDKTIMKAWNAKTKTIDLKILHNQFELITMLGKISNIKIPKGSNPIDTYYKDPLWIKKWFNSITTKLNFKLKFDSSTSQAYKWDIASMQKDTSAAIDVFETIKDPDAKNKAKAFDIEKKGVNPSTQTPIDLEGIFKIGESFLSNKAVQGLKYDDPIFATQLAKLLNLPKDAFTGFSNLLKNIDSMLSDIWSTREMQHWKIHYSLDMKLLKCGTSKELIKSKELKYIRETDSPDKIMRMREELRVKSLFLTMNFR